MGLWVLQPRAQGHDAHRTTRWTAGSGSAVRAGRYSVLCRWLLNQQNLIVLNERKQKRFGHMKKNTTMTQLPSRQENASLKLTVRLVLSLFPLAELPLELQLVGEEHLSPSHVLGQGPHVRGDVVTGRLNDLLPQFVTLAQLWVEKARGGSCHTRLQQKSSSHSQSPCPAPAACGTREETLHKHEDMPSTAPASDTSSLRTEVSAQISKDKTTLD